MLFRHSIFLFVVFICWAGGAHAADGKPAESLAALIEAALADNPDLKYAQADARMWTSMVPQASALDDPVLKLEIKDGLVKYPLRFNQDSMTTKVIGISQQIPFWGKRKLKGEIAAGDAESARWKEEEVKLELIRAVKDVYYQIYYTDKSLEIVARNIGILDDFIAIAATKYAVGQGAQQDVLKAQVERAKLLELEISLEETRKSLAAALNALLNRQAETPVGEIPDFDIAPLAMSADEVRNLTWENNPRLKNLKAQIGKARAGLNLANKELYYPDFNVSFDYGIRDVITSIPAFERSFAGTEWDGLDNYTLTVLMNVPLQRERRHAAVAESTSTISEASAELRSYRNILDSGISDLLAKLEKREQLVNLYKTGIIPLAEQNLDSAIIGYRVDKTDFETLLDSWRTLFDYERSYYESLAEYRKLAALGDAVAGAELH